MRTTFGGKYGLSLGGFPCIRGYATLRDIARISFADLAYQRELTPEHVDEIKRYFAAGEYLFFPEIILSTTLQVDYEKPGAPQGDPLQAVMKGQKFTSNVNDLRITPRTSRYDISVADDDRPNGAPVSANRGPDSIPDGNLRDAVRDPAGASRDRAEGASPARADSLSFAFQA